MQFFLNLSICLVTVIFTLNQGYCAAPAPSMPTPATNQPPAQTQPAPQAAPAQAPQAKPAQASQATPAATVKNSAPAPVQTGAATSTNYDKELDEIYQKLNQVTVAKKELKQKLHDIEEKLDSARKIAVESKEISFKIIQQPKISDAENLVAQVDKNLQNLLATQKTLKDTDLPNFQANAKNIEDLIQLIQNKTEELKGKGLTLQISQAQLELQKESPLLAKTGIQASGEAKSPTPKEKTFLQKSYCLAILTAANGIRLTKKAWHNFRNWVYSHPEKSTTVQESTEAKKNSKTLEIQKKSAFTIQNTLTDIDNIIKQLDEIQILMTQKYTAIKRTVKNLDIMLRSNDEVRKYFENKEEQNPAWKESLVNGFSATVDGVYTIGKGIKKTTKALYNKYLVGFITDVKNKISEQENSSENQSQTNQTQENQQLSQRNTDKIPTQTQKSAAPSTPEAPVMPIR